MSENDRSEKPCEITNQDKSKKRLPVDEDNLANILKFENFNNYNTEGKEKPYFRKRKRATRSILNDVDPVIYHDND